ncbi:ParB N-terminal domain-containing protein [Methylobacterium sp. J-090]|uniref:ParB N-terminal domain-containing protein n=1 Tax=Methylobacterium sp. J-090 TaxID=2836666 RepID=UPI001FB95D0D|nr:ParB N-terminal domain-containing protein [Methylobacterium sp. J-090]MCJ2081732.1 hypothetical protein [Methylobacterium sp. J-090]
MIDPDCALFPVKLLRPTEEAIPARAREVVAMILADQAWKQPICIEGTVHALLDGHHRLVAARELGLVRVPVQVFDYAEVELLSWRPDFAPTRAEVLARALSGELYPPKTTRHVFPPRQVWSVPLWTLQGLRGPGEVRLLRRCPADLP